MIALQKKDGIEEAVRSIAAGDFVNKAPAIYSVSETDEDAFSFGQIMYMGAKRLFDIAFGLIGIVLLIPMMLIVKICYLVSGDKDPIMFKHERLGKDGKKIEMWKFRTMIPNAESKLSEVLKNEEFRKEWESSQKIANDPRITKAGKVLRRLSIDEFPQFINVLTGDMSLIGPRPLVAGELEKHGGIKLYQKVKPGITGWWACNGRSSVGYDERLELEYYYIENYGLALDVMCFLKTIMVVLKKENAY
ncbi:MAG: sugar transferase [Lachnospiraceae bacterium]|nr:sugar transferase [Lachnospiraceae bacterium]